MLPGHAPVISALRPGIIDVTLPQGRQRLFVKGGVAEVDADAPHRAGAERRAGRGAAMVRGWPASCSLAEAQVAEAKDDNARMMAETLVDVLKRLQAKAA